MANWCGVIWKTPGKAASSVAVSMPPMTRMTMRSLRRAVERRLRSIGE